MADKNWLAQKGNAVSDSDALELGVSQDVLQSDGFNRAMLDAVHAQNMAGYISDGMPESEARHMADKQRHMAMKAAKENGLKM
jgi:hypothetical protein